MMAATENENQVRAFSKYPLLLLSGCFAGGIMLAGFVSPSIGIVTAACLIAAVLAATLAGRGSAALLLALAFLFAGSFVYLLEIRGVSENRTKRIIDEGLIESGEPVEIEGVLAGEPERTFDGLIVTVDADSIRYAGQHFDVEGRVRIFAPIRNELHAAEYEQLDLTHGSIVRIACNLEREERYQNPGVLSRIALLDQQGIDAGATIKSPLLIEKIGDKAFTSPMSRVYQYRSRLTEKFLEKFDRPTASVMAASLLGNKHFLDKQTADVFREGGTFHILVISGLHITFIGGLVVIFTRLFTRRRSVQFVVATVFLWTYTLAVGAEVPVVRASVMFTVLLFSQVIHRDGTLLNALGACCLALLVWRPQDIFNPSFHLTFVSVAAIVAMAFPLIEKLRAIGNWIPTAENPFPANVPVWLKRFCETLYWREVVWNHESGRNIWSANLFKSPYLKWLDSGGRKRILAYLFEGVLVSLIVQIWLLPFLIVYFHRVSFGSIILNLWVGSIIAVESFSALFALLLSGVSEWMAFPLIKFTEFLNWLLIAVPGMFTAQTSASVRVPVYSGFPRVVYAAYFVPVLLLAFALSSWKPFAIVAESGERRLFGRIAALSSVILSVVGIVTVFHPYSAPASNGRLQIEFLDVGQGDSALVTFPNGKTMLVDGGGYLVFRQENEEDDVEPFEPDTPRLGEAVVSEFLWEKGYSEIDHLLATHADADHIQGLADVAKNFSITLVFAGQPSSSDPDFVELSEVLAQNRVPLINLYAGERLEFGGAVVEVIHPSDAALTSLESENNRSVVIRITYGERSFLLAGDIELDAERQLMQASRNLRADVVKVPHHGSRTSSSQGFIEAVGAEYAVFSVGKRSMFGHPHAEVVERWQTAGAKLLKTGDTGTITFSTDGRDLVVNAYVR